MGRNLTEQEIYKIWEESGSFAPSDSDKTYFIPMPPPNITGKLHMGHAYFATLQDILIRHHRMLGYSTLWLPGCDHAGMATQEKLDQEMLGQGLDPNGPEFEEFSSKYKTSLSAEIIDQLKRTGASCDWSRFRYTMDEDYTTSIHKAFDICSEKQLLYKDSDDHWYLDMTDAANRLLDEIYNNNIEIIPESGRNTLIHYLKNIQPWCISRDIRWGHKMPNDDRYVLDTWFSSSLWTFATLGWGTDNQNDFDKFFPANMLETGDDIIFFWCARMLMMGLILTDKLCFSRIYLHGLILDGKGRKMSKSLGNGIDPIDIIEEYGCDAMRFALAEYATPAQNMKLDIRKLSSSKKLLTKFRNTMKFSSMHCGEIITSTHEDDIEIMRRLSEVFLETKDMMDACEFHLYAQKLRSFLYDDYSSWYIEKAKRRLFDDDREAKATISALMDATLKLFHPIIPFTTEQIYMNKYDTLLIAEKSIDIFVEKCIFKEC